MKASINNQTHFECEYLNTEDEESSIQIPHESNNKGFCVREGELEELDTDKISPLLHAPSCRINTSITFKKPSNYKFPTTRASSYDADTQCDSVDSDSDEDSPIIAEPQWKMTPTDYLKLMERTWFLVKETKERRFRGLASPIVLRHKLYEILSRHSAPANPDFLFVQGDLGKGSTIRRFSAPWIQSPEEVYEKQARRPKRKHSSKTNGFESAMNSLFKFLTKPN